MGPGQDPYGALWARARTLMGPMGPGPWAHILNQPGEDDGDDGSGIISQSIQAPSSTYPGTTYPVRTIPHSD